MRPPGQPAMMPPPPARPTWREQGSFGAEADRARAADEEVWREGMNYELDTGTPWPQRKWHKRDQNSSQRAKSDPDWDASRSAAWREWNELE
jgi:hypothetical protein